MDAGKEEEARRIHNAKLVLENSLASMPRRRGRKEVLVRRGVITHPYGRNLGPEELDDVDLAELEYALDFVEPYFTV